MNFKSFFLGLLASTITMLILTTLIKNEFLIGWISCLSYIFVSDYFDDKKDKK